VNGVNIGIGKVGHYPKFFPSPYLVRSTMALGMDGGKTHVSWEIGNKIL